jgi:hypothetical protein
MQSATILVNACNAKGYKNRDENLRVLRETLRGQEVHVFISMMYCFAPLGQGNWVGFSILQTFCTSGATYHLNSDIGLLSIFTFIFGCKPPRGDQVFVEK